MKKLSETECNVLIKQSGFNFQRGITGDKLISTTQMVSVKELHRIVEHAFIVGQEHERHKHDKKKKHDKEDN